MEKGSLVLFFFSNLCFPFLVGHSSNDRCFTSPSCLGVRLVIGGEHVSGFLSFQLLYLFLDWKCALKVHVGSLRLDVHKMLQG